MRRSLLTKSRSKIEKQEFKSQIEKSVTGQSEKEQPPIETTRAGSEKESTPDKRKHQREMCRNDENSPKVTRER